MFKRFEDYDYEINEKCVVRNMMTKRVLRCYLGDKGYLLYCIYKNKKMKTIPVHRMVAITFIDNPESKRCINHINGIKTDNRLSNLEWATHSENTKHAYDLGIIGSGENHYNSKFSNQQIEYIKQNPENLSGNKLAELTGCSIALISLIKNNKIRVNG